MSEIENRSTLGPEVIKGLTAKVYKLKNQADQAYSLAIDSALGVENNNFFRLFKSEKSNNARELITSKTGVGYGTITPEGEDFASDSRIVGYKTEFNFQTITKGITITLQDQLDRIVDRKLSELKDLMVSAKMTKDRDAFSVFNYAFTAQTSLPRILTYYGDGKPLASIAHPLKGSTTSTSTYSNASASGLPLTEVNLETARSALRNQLDDKGLPMNIGSSGLTLVVPVELEKKALEITNSNLKSNTANNDLNIYRDGIMTVMSTKWINAANGGSDTQWFLVDTAKSPLIFFDRNPITTSVYRTDSNKNITTDYYMRYQVGNDTWRALWASLGAGASYTG